MRYMIDTLGEKAQEWGNRLRIAEENNEIRILEKGDPIEEIKDSVRKIDRALVVLRKSGISDEIMIAYMRTKGLSLKNIEEVLKYQKEFFRKLGAYK